MTEALEDRQKNARLVWSNSTLTLEKDWDIVTNIAETLGERHITKAHRSIN